MDAAEADADIKLYKASSELLLELQIKLPLLVQYRNTYRNWVVSSKVYEVTRLLDAFQEWPQLLDPCLASLIQVLVDGYLSYCVSSSQKYLRVHGVDKSLIPLPRGIARILYAFCKVRGRKIIVRLLNNEPRYVEPLVSCFRLWTSHLQSISDNFSVTMTWEERYIHLLWLSHLMLAPFELSTISSMSLDADEEIHNSNLCSGLPDISTILVSIGLSHIQEPSKAREAAGILLVRLLLRSDMQKLGLAQHLVDWAVTALRTPFNEESSTGYRHIGLLELLFGIMNSASLSEAAPFIKTVFETAHSAATSPQQHFQAIRDSAPARKLLVKVMRSSVVHAVMAGNTLQGLVNEMDVNAMLEDCIQILLDFLADKDTPVRQAASKALSLICLRLDPQMSSEIVEAVIDGLDENMLLEDVATGRLFSSTDIPKRDSTQYRKNLNAVDALKWHGSMLTLGHFLFRRSLPTSQLSAVIEALLMGLDFEQRSNVGTSVGVGVRDAACFGIWSLARKYSTAELNQASISTFLIPHPHGFSDASQNSTLQTIATHLAMSACLDPSGNLRRGSSAALQELIGRHPDAIVAGIPVVQTIDYNAIARRSRAVTEVAIAASKLSGHYQGALLYAMLGWRGVKSTDADSRRQAAHAAGLLLPIGSKSDLLPFIHKLVSEIGYLKATNNGSNASARHGLLCCLAAVIESLSQEADENILTEAFDVLMPLFQDMTYATGSLDGRVTTDIENVFEAVSKVILAVATYMAQFVGQTSFPAARQVASWLTSVTSILDRCTVSSDKQYVTDIAAKANVAVLNLLEEKIQQDLLAAWLDQKQQSKANFTCKGRIASLGQILQCIHEKPSLQHFRRRIVAYLCDIITSYHFIETKVNAMQNICIILQTPSALDNNDLASFIDVIHAGLTNYTIDRRGDIGSLLRLESIEAAKQLLDGHVTDGQKQSILQLIVKLAAEKLVKVRFHAWKCLEEHLTPEITTGRSFNHQVDVSSFDYFMALVELLNRSQYREQVLLGLIGSLTGGTEEVARACMEALIIFVQNQDISVQQKLTDFMITTVAQHVTNLTSADDQQLVTHIEFLAFVTEHILVYQTRIHGVENVYIWDMCDKVHIASSTIIRVEAMIRLYSSLMSVETCCMQALDRLTRLLLHRWPKVRGAAADAIYEATSVGSMLSCDWNAPVVKNKPSVLTLRKELKVAGIATPKP